MANLNVRLKNQTGDILYPQTLAANVLNLDTFIQGQISSAGLLKREIVAALPSDDISETTIYMILKDPAGSGQNVYNEYMYIDSKWELIGDTAVDLTGYATEAYVTSAIANKADKATTLAGYGITDGATKTELSDAVSTINTALDGKANKSTTLAGYGITDAVSDSELAAAKSELQGNIDAKADSSVVTALQGTVATKADQADLDALSDSVSALKEQVNGLVSSQITY